ncbi:hypothetical protein [Cypionkella sp.]|uniref:hypothetical protein n=1 Tax=Cypionkella sp. TaxID=2811411 RepID=UPI002AB8C0DE|nr:hypothetical protein [Cypionkella sp.]MDZ4391824.1 hypothetical protein [Cypionkella sp.]
MRGLSHVACAALALGLLGQAAAAETVQPCDDARSNAWNIAEPWDANTRFFANGAVRLTVMDTVEPAAAAFHLLVLSPPLDELEGRQCRVVSLDGATGFASLSLTGTAATYDPTKGLTISVPAKRYLPDTGEFGAATLVVTINQSTGAISAQLD